MTSRMCPRCNQHYVTEHRCPARPFGISDDEAPSPLNAVIAAEVASEIVDSGSSSYSSDSSPSSDFSGGGGDSGGGGSSGSW